MSLRALDDETLRRYLLGSLADDAAEQLDELSVIDGDVAARLRAIEHDLVDAFVNGELSGEVLDRFQSHYLASPANRSRVTFAESLRQYLRKAERLPAQSFGSWSWASRWGLAAAAAIALVASAYLLTENVRLRGDVSRASQAAAQLQERERQLQTQLTQALAANAETTKELARVRESPSQPERRPTDSPRSSGLGVLAFTLQAATRGPDGVPALVVPRATETILLRLPLEMDDHSRYQAVLKSAGATTEIWRSGELRSTADGAARILSVTIPVRLLRARFYTIEVSGIPAPGNAQYLSSYPFSVVLQ
jgi:hypothetical protein